MNRRRLLRRLAGGAVNNVAFKDIVDLAQAMGFREVRVAGSHHIFANDNVPGLLNLQEVDGEAKPYQVRQLLRMIERYNLKIEGK